MLQSRRFSSWGFFLALVYLLDIVDAIPYGPYTNGEVRPSTSRPSRSSEATKTTVPGIINGVTNLATDSFTASSTDSDANYNGNSNINVQKSHFDNNKTKREQLVSRQEELLLNYESDNKDYLMNSFAKLNGNDNILEIMQHRLGIPANATNVRTKVSDKCKTTGRRSNNVYSRSFPRNESSINVADAFQVLGDAEAKKTSSVHVGEDITLCWIETITIKEDPAFDPPKRLVIREFTISFENSATVPETSMECTKLEGEILPGDENTVCGTALNEVIDEDTAQSQVVNFTKHSREGSINIHRYKTIKCATGSVVYKDIFEWPDGTDNPKKRVEIKVGPSLRNVRDGSQTEPAVCPPKADASKIQAQLPAFTPSNCTSEESCDESASCADNEDCDQPDNSSSCEDDDCLSSSSEEILPNVPTSKDQKIAPNETANPIAKVKLRKPLIKLPSSLKPKTLTPREPYNADNDSCLENGDCDVADTSIDPDTNEIEDCSGENCTEVFSDVSVDGNLSNETEECSEDNCDEEDELQLTPEKDETSALSRESEIVTKVVEETTITPSRNTTAAIIVNNVECDSGSSECFKTLSGDNLVGTTPYVINSPEINDPLSNDIRKDTSNNYGVDSTTTPTEPEPSTNDSRKNIAEDFEGDSTTIPAESESLIRNDEQKDIPEAMEVDSTTTPTEPEPSTNHSQKDIAEDFDVDYTTTLAEPEILIKNDEQKEISEGMEVDSTTIPTESEPPMNDVQKGIQEDFEFDSTTNSPESEISTNDLQTDIPVDIEGFSTTIVAERESSINDVQKDTPKDSDVNPVTSPTEPETSVNDEQKGIPEDFEVDSTTISPELETSMNDLKKDIPNDYKVESATAPAVPKSAISDEQKASTDELEVASASIPAEPDASMNDEQKGKPEDSEVDSTSIPSEVAASTDIHTTIEFWSTTMRPPCIASESEGCETGAPIPVDQVPLETMHPLTTQTTPTITKKIPEEDGTTIDDLEQSGSCTDGSTSEECQSNASENSSESEDDDLTTEVLPELFNTTLPPLSNEYKKSTEGVDEAVTSITTSSIRPETSTIESSTEGTPPIQNVTQLGNDSIPHTDPATECTSNVETGSDNCGRKPTNVPALTSAESNNPNATSASCESSENCSSEEDILSSAVPNIPTDQNLTTVVNNVKNTSCEDSTESCESASSSTSSESCEGSSSGEKCTNSESSSKSCDSSSASCSSESETSIGLGNETATTESTPREWEQFLTTTENMSATAETRRSTMATEAPTSDPSKAQHQLALRVKILLEHINEKKEREKLVRIEKHLLLHDGSDDNRNHSLVWQIKSLNNSMNIETLKSVFNCSDLENLVGKFKYSTEIEGKNANTMSSGETDEEDLSLEKLSAKPKTEMQDNREEKSKEILRRKKREISTVTGDEERTTNITGKNITEVNITGINITGINTTDANMTEIDATGINMTGINMTDTNMTGIDTTEISTTGIDVTGINMTENNIAEENTTGENLTESTKIHAIKKSLSEINKDLQNGLGHVLHRISHEFVGSGMPTVNKSVETPSSTILKVLANPNDTRVHPRRRKRTANLGEQVTVRELQHRVNGEEIGRWSNERFVKAADGGRVRSLLEFEIMRNPSDDFRRNFSGS